MSGACRVEVSAHLISPGSARSRRVLSTHASWESNTHRGHMSRGPCFRREQWDLWMLLASGCCSCPDLLVVVERGAGPHDRKFENLKLPV
jgi:hypothetical protein